MPRRTPRPTPTPSPVAGLIQPPEYADQAYMGLLLRATETDRKRLLLGIPCTGNVRIEWAMARYGQAIPTNWGLGECLQLVQQITPLGYNVADARNIIAHVAVTQGYEWLLWNDSDTIPPPHFFVAMNEYVRRGDKPIVSGLYTTKSDPPEPLVYRGYGTSYYRDFTLGDRFWVSGCG